MSDDRIQRLSAPLRHQVIDRLRQAIVSMQYQPGERLREKALCDRYGVSRTVIREALRHLEAEGLVSVIPDTGPIVAVLSQEEAEGLFEVRAVLEALAGKLFVERATSKEARTLLRRFEDVRRAYSRASLADQLQAKDAFYDALFDGAHNEVIRSTLRTLHNRIQMLRGLSLQAQGRTEQSIAELQAIVDALVTESDPEMASAACEKHVLAAGAVALKQLQLTR